MDKKNQRKIIFLVFVMIFCICISVPSEPDVYDGTYLDSPIEDGQGALNRGANAKQQMGMPYHSPSTPIKASISVSSYPGLYQPTRVICEITSTLDAPGTTAQIELPSSARLLEGALTWEGDIFPGKPVTFTATIEFVKEGDAAIFCRVLREIDAQDSWGDLAAIYMSIGKTNGSPGFIGSDSRQVETGKPIKDGEGQVIDKDVKSPVPPGPLGVVDEPIPDIEPSSSGQQAFTQEFAQVAGTLTVTGRWGYIDRDNSYMGSREFLVQLVRGDNYGHLAWGYTDLSGYYSIGPVTNPGSAGVRTIMWSYTQYAPYSDILAVVNPDWGTTGSVDYAFGVQTPVTVFSDGTRDIGSWMCGSGSDYQRAYWIQRDLVDTWRFIWFGAGSGQSPQETAGPCNVEWKIDSTHGTHYHLGGNVQLAGIDPLSDTVVSHEYAHNIMYTIYGNWFPTTYCPSPHYIQWTSHVNCAWTEGWANFLPLAVNNDPVFRWPSGATLNLETPTWGTSGWDNGDAVEGRVAGAIWDIYDTVNDGYDQYSDGGVANIWDTIYHQNDNNFSEYWTAWKTRGHNVSDASMSLYQNTIDYECPTQSAPSAPSASDGTYSDRVYIYWNSASGATSYQVYRGTSSSTSSMVAISSWQGSTSYNDYSVTPGTTYYYRIKAKNSCGNESTYSDYNSGYASCPAQSAPSTPSASDGTYSDRVYIYWNSASGATSYQVYRGTSSSTSSMVAISSWQSSTSYNDYSVTPGTTYYYRIKAKNSCGNESTYSDYNSGYASCPGQTAPSTPSASDGTYPDRVYISWSSVSGATSYQVYRGISSSTSGLIALGSWSSSTNYNDYTASPGITYYYRVKAKNVCENESTYSNYNTGYVQLHTVSQSNSPSGSTSGVVGTSYTFTTGGSSCSQGHSVQYQFDWGDGAYSGWLAVGVTSASHIWSSANTYIVKTIARCSINNTVESIWSSGLSINIDNVVPYISSLNPTQSVIGIPVTISGSNFGSTQGTVTFNGVNATINFWTQSQIETVVPSGATTGPVVVHTDAGQDSNGVTFTVIQGSAKKADFDGDGRADVIWRYQAAEGYNAVWLSGNAGSAASGTASVSSHDAIRAMNMDRGKPGMIMLSNIWATLPEARRNSVIDGFSGLENMPGNVLSSANLEAMSRVMATSVSDPRNDSQSVNLDAVADQNWKLAGTGDFNGDGHIDIVWSNVGTAQNCVWYMNGTTFAGYAQLPDGSTTDWVLGGVGDFDRDGHPDLIWHNVVDGRNGMWYLDGVQLKGIDIMTTGANVDWQLCGTGDFNNDGHVDLVWRNITDGRNAVWYMDGVVMTSVGWIDTVADQNWKLRGTGDFNNDGKIDLVWTFISDGRNCVWHLDGITLTNVTFLTTVTDTTWMIKNQ